MAQRSTSRSPQSKESDDSALLTASENVARVLGVIFIVIGLGLIIFLIGGFIFSKLPYRVDPNLPIPTLDETEEHTNKDAIDVSGNVLPGEEVALYQDEERLKDTVETDEEGNFVFEEVELSEEGETTFKAAVVRGGIFKQRSEYSNDVMTFIDWTSPSSQLSLEYEALSIDGKVDVKGTAEPNTVIIVESDTEKYEVTVDESGEFELKGIALSAGENSFEVRIKDRAGNEVLAAKKVEVTYEAGDINGDGVSVAGASTQLPESAGELEAALEFLSGNQLMLAMAALALGGFALSSIGVRIHSRKSQA